MKMEKQFTLFWILNFALIIATKEVASYVVDNNPYRHQETLDKDGNYKLEWLVDWPESRIIFNVTVKTKGYVGLGLSRKEKMLGADIVIGGVLSNGQPYFSDRHAIGNQLPVEDTSQDWVLHQAWETDSHTFLSFSRSFETCDQDHDLPITGDVTALLWAYGEKDDDIEYHYQNRGVLWTYLLDPDLTPTELQKSAKLGINENDKRLGDWNVWQIQGQELIPDKETTYMCSLHKVPFFNQKQHAVGFRAILPTELEERHIHHFLFKRCTPPAGQNADRTFQHLLGRKEECYIPSIPTGLIPTQYCSEFFYVWAVGMKPIFLPDHTGLPINPNEYFLLQMHFDNPNRMPNIQLNYGLDIFYTENLRKYDAGIMVLGELTPSSPSIIVPPNSLAHETYGHCASECTESIIPAEGIRVFAGFPHTHLAGRGIRLLHFRNNQELPWIVYDNNYNFNYQQIRILPEERLILPGDKLYVRCILENTDRQGNVTIGGFSTREEMCVTIVWYYNKIPDRFSCHSDLRSDEYRKFLQIYNTTWSNERIERVVTSPQSNAGLLVSEVANLKIEWNLKNRKQLQELHRNSPQTSLCPRSQPQNAPEDIPQHFLFPPKRFFHSGISQPRRVTTLSSASFMGKPRITTLSRPSVSGKVFGNTAEYSEWRNENGNTNPSGEFEFISVFPRNAKRYKPDSVCNADGNRRNNKIKK